jgi:regulator of sigma E protease
VPRSEAAEEVSMPAVLTNALAFIFALGVIIFVHELGHLVVGKLFGMRVRAFSLGFGKRLWGFEHGSTDYRVSLIPLGGYVQFGGEDPGDVGEDPREFLNRPRWQRLLVYLAGPAMNIILAVLLVAFVFMLGIEVAAPPDIPAVVGSVRPESPAATAGLQADDLIVAIDDKKVSQWEDARFAILTAPETPLAIEYERQGERYETVLTPLKVPRYEFGDAGLYPKLLPRVAALFPGDPAARAGFEVGDEIRSVDGQPVASQNQFIEYVSQRPGEALEVEVLRRGRDPILLTVVPRDDDGRGWIGVSLTLTAFQRFGPAESLVQSVRFNWSVTRQTISVIGKIFTGQLAAKSALSGPIQIAALSGAAARSGFRNLLHLMGLISISIAILNLLPIPALDGGQITVLLVESLFRRDLSLKIKERINQVGFLLIVMLMAMVLYFDLVKVIPEGILPGS